MTVLTDEQVELNILGSNILTSKYQLDAELMRRTLSPEQRTALWLRWKARWTADLLRWGELRQRIGGRGG